MMSEKLKFQHLRRQINQLDQWAESKGNSSRLWDAALKFDQGETRCNVHLFIYVFMYLFHSQQANKDALRSKLPELYWCHVSWTRAGLVKPSNWKRKQHTIQSPLTGYGRDKTSIMCRFPINQNTSSDPASQRWSAMETEDTGLIKQNAGEGHCL